MTIHQRHIEAIAVAVLAVNSYPLAKVMNIVPRLKTNELLTPSYVAALDIGTLTVQLFEAGYERGMLTSRIAERFNSLMSDIDKGVLDALQDLVTRKNQNGAIQLLLTLRGVGPRVANTAWTLMVQEAHGTSE